MVGCGANAASRDNCPDDTGRISISGTRRSCARCRTAAASSRWDRTGVAWGLDPDKEGARLGIARTTAACCRSASGTGRTTPPPTISSDIFRSPICSSGRPKPAGSTRCDSQPGRRRGTGARTARRRIAHAPRPTPRRFPSFRAPSSPGRPTGCCAPMRRLTARALGNQYRAGIPDRQRRARQGRFDQRPGPGHRRRDALHELGLRLHRVRSAGNVLLAYSPE
jgi:hypothetical protein